MRETDLSEHLASVRRQLLASMPDRAVLLDGMLHPFTALSARTGPMRSMATRLPIAALSVAIAVVFGGCSTDDKKTTPAPTPHDVDSGGSLFNNEPDASHSPNGADGGGCKGFGRSPACGACLEDKCCDVTIACAWAPGCSDNIVCIRDCDGKTGDAGDACQQACADKYFAQAGSQYNQLVACMNGSCHTECPFSSP